jgi:hypothetical protein
VQKRNGVEWSSTVHCLSCRFPLHGKNDRRTMVGLRAAQTFSKLPLSSLAPDPRREPCPHDPPSCK